jgi:hypothetical protein
MGGRPWIGNLLRNITLEEREIIMATDVKLDQVDGGFLVLEGRVVKATAADFMLDSPARRLKPTPFRRALVHNQSDGLTVNFNGDYPGGITLNGVTEISAQTLKGGPLSVLVDPTPILKLQGSLTFEVTHVSPEHLSSSGELTGGEVTVDTFTLHVELEKLQNQISALQAKVTVLEAKK